MTIQNRELDFFFHLVPESCGRTVEIFEADFGVEVQCILSIPLNRLDHDDPKRQLSEVLSVLERKGFQPHPDETSIGISGLLNEAELEVECVYRPQRCLGQHLNVSVHGYLS